MTKLLGDILLWISRWRVFVILEFPVFYLLLRSKLSSNPRDGEPRLFWGPIPILNNKYWSKALGKRYTSHTVMASFYDSINKREDFDLYGDDILNTFRLPKFLLLRYKEYFLTYYMLREYDIFHIPFTGAFLGNTRHWRKEAPLFKKYGKKAILLPYGADAYMYSRIKNESFQQAMLISYPQAAREENAIAEKVFYWSKHADFIPAGFMIDGFPRWDLVVGNFITIDTSIFKEERVYTTFDGRNGPVHVMHCPNHRGAKGTEFLLTAVSKLKAEGLDVVLLLIENKKNDDVLRILETQADILVEQLIMGYGLNAIEGMASGIATVSNLSNECYTRLFRRYGTLDECPIISATPESIYETLKTLVTMPQLREKLGRAGKLFTQKYHSEKFALFLFNNIYDRIWYGKNVDFSHLLHPHSPESYNNKYERVQHPLTDSILQSTNQ